MAISHNVKLLGFQLSPFVHRVIWALKIKGVPFEYVEEDLQNKSSTLLESNPVHKKVPVLVHAGLSISESQVILEYIGETWPDDQNSLLPKCPYDRAMARFWSKYIDEKVLPVVRVLLGPKETGQQIATIRQALKPVDEQLKGKKFFGGESIGFTDIVAGCLSYFLEAYSIMLGVQIILEDEFPNLHVWTKTIMEVEVIRENVPEQDDIVAHLTRLRKKFTSVISS